MIKVFDTLINETYIIGIGDYKISVRDTTISFNLYLRNYKIEITSKSRDTGYIPLDQLENEVHKLKSAIENNNYEDYFKTT